MTQRKTHLGELLSSTPGEDELDASLFDSQQELIGRMGRHWNRHSLLFLKRQTLSRILFLDMIYQKIINVPGYILEFGVQWGASLGILMHLRGIYEPYNYSRRIIGFDTFKGFPELSEEDGSLSTAGDYRTMENYEDLLADILSIHEAQSPLNHITKHELVKGDVCNTLEGWKDRNPALVIALAFFDMDLYRPTVFALENILDKCIKGSVLVFDEFNCDKFPGETRAVLEVLGPKLLKRVPDMPYCAYYVVD